MPMLFPTPDELANLSPQTRAKVLRQVRSILLESEAITRTAVERVNEAKAEGERIREHARLLLAYTPKDDPMTIIKRRQTLLEALK